MKTLNVELSIDEITTMIKTMEYYYGMSLRIEMNPSEYAPSVIKEVMDHNKIIKELVPKLRERLNNDL